MSSSPWMSLILPQRRTRSRRARRGYKARRGRSPGWLATEALEERVLLNGTLLTVNSTGDEATPNVSSITLSLREAIEIADGGLPVGSLTAAQQAQVTSIPAAGFTIVFDASLNGQAIMLGGTELPQITGSVTITGPGASLLAVSANNNSPVLDIAATGSATISGLTIEDGMTPDVAGADGGGIRNSGTLVLSGSTVSNSRAIYYGGDIYNSGTATITDSTLSGNIAYRRRRDLQLRSI